MTSDVKQKINQKAFTLPQSFLCCYMKPQKKTDQVGFTLVQELGRHLQWSKDGYSILKQRKMS